MRSLFVYLNIFFDMILTPFSLFPTYVDIIAISLMSAVMVLYIFKKVSKQEKIRQHKEQIYGNVIQIATYNDQLRVVVKSILAVFKHNSLYLVYAIPPLFFIFIPLFVCTTQINNRFGYSPLEENEKFIIRVELERDVLNRTPERLNQVNLVSSPGIEIETEPLRIVSLASVFWRARVTDTKDQQFVRLTMDGDDQSIEKKVVTHPQKKRFSPEKSKWHLWGSLVNHGEDFLPNTSPFLTIKVSYGRGSYPFLFWNTDPIILYFIFTFVFALLLKPIIKVYI